LISCRIFESLFHADRLAEVMFILLHRCNVCIKKTHALRKH